MSVLPSTLLSFSHFREALGKANNVPIRFGEMYAFTAGTPTSGVLSAGVFPREIQSRWGTKYGRI
jgi:hypothetical protein